MRRLNHARIRAVCWAAVAAGGLFILVRGLAESDWWGAFTGTCFGLSGYMVAGSLWREGASRETHSATPTAQSPATQSELRIQGERARPLSLFVVRTDGQVLQFHDELGPDGAVRVQYEAHERRGQVIAHRVTMGGGPFDVLDREEVARLPVDDCREYYFG